MTEELNKKPKVELIKHVRGDGDGSLSVKAGEQVERRKVIVVKKKSAAVPPGAKKPQPKVVSVQVQGKDIPAAAPASGQGVWEEGKRFSGAASSPARASGKKKKGSATGRPRRGVRRIAWHGRPRPWVWRREKEKEKEATRKRGVARASRPWVRRIAWHGRPARGFGGRRKRKIKRKEGRGTRFQPGPRRRSPVRGTTWNSNCPPSPRRAALF
jgi:hypothetical protein